MAAAAGDGDAALKLRSAVQAAAQGSCAWPGCADDGTFRAPRSRRRADGFYMFCLAHVRDYNAAWDFFAGMTPDQIAAYRHEDVTWHRPTRRFSGRGGSPGEWGDEIRMRDELGIFAAAFGADGGIDGIDPRAAERPMKPGEGAALKVFGLDRHATLNDIKARYKELAKRYHPDATGGDKRSEDRFKAVNKAYRYLLACGYA
ncbi:J domain-containing protein [Marinibaculum pumilum]|uniref:J domain-containing protein n=1 Tax=Marinibaculum pumilum TaxID=1766165 RepID=A0ABV7KXI0_9PROT